MRGVCSMALHLNAEQFVGKPTQGSERLPFWALYSFLQSR